MFRKINRYFWLKHSININLLKSNWTAGSAEHHISSTGTLCCGVISIVLAWGGFLPYCETSEWLCLPAGPPSTWGRAEKNTGEISFSDEASSSPLPNVKVEESNSSKSLWLPIRNDSHSRTWVSVFILLVPMQREGEAT